MWKRRKNERLSHRGHLANSASGSWQWFLGFLQVASTSKDNLEVVCLCFYFITYLENKNMANLHSRGPECIIHARKSRFDIVKIIFRKKLLAAAILKLVLYHVREWIYLNTNFQHLTKIRLENPKRNDLLTPASLGLSFTKKVAIKCGFVFLECVCGINSNNKRQKRWKIGPMECNTMVKTEPVKR